MKRFLVCAPGNNVVGTFDTAEEAAQEMKQFIEFCNSHHVAGTNDVVIAREEILMYEIAEKDAWKLNAAKQCQVNECTRRATHIVTQSDKPSKHMFVCPAHVRSALKLSVTNTIAPIGVPLCGEAPQ